MLNIVVSDNKLMDDKTVHARLIYNSVLQRSSLSVVEVWREGCYLCEVRRVTKAGLRVILASPWYLDQPGPTHNWARYYTVWPHAFKGQINAVLLINVVLTDVGFVINNDLLIAFLMSSTVHLTKYICSYATRWQAVAYASVLHRRSICSNSILHYA